MFFITEQLANMSEINSLVYIGSLESAQNLTNLESNGITHILNLTDYDYDFGNRNYKKIAIIDSVTQKISNLFDEAFVFIKQAKERQGKVLIHCEYGMSRSVSFAIAWLMYEQHEQMQMVSYTDTIREVLEVRPMASPNRFFQKQLEEFADELNKSFLAQNPVANIHMLI